MSDLVLDAARSRVTVHTFAEGLLARLAHDLEIGCQGLEGSATGDIGKATARIDAPLRGIAVRGVLGKNGQVDERAPSASDRREILAKMASDVFHAGANAVVRIEAHVDRGAARVRIAPPNGKAVEIVLQPALLSEGVTIRASGAFELSLAAIGSDAVRGPLGSFRIKDRVRVSFDVVFQATSSIVSS